MADIDGICDEILKFVRDNRSEYWENPLDDRIKIFGQSVSSSDFKVALDRLKNNQPPLLEQKGNFNWYYRTGEGVKFIDGGGFSMKNRIEQTEKIENEQDRILSRQVNQSTIDTNASVQELNKKTGDIYDFQKTSTHVTVFVASCAVLVSVISLFKKDVSKEDIQSVQTEISKIRTGIDSL